MTRYKSRNFYTQDIDNNITALFSYDTLVGFKYFDTVFFTKQKYSSTTSKQCTMYANENRLTRHDVDTKYFNTLKRYFYNYNAGDRVAIYNLHDTLNLIALGV